MKPFGDQIENSSSDSSPSKEEPLASPVEDQPENSENGNGSSNAAKKPAWNKPSNGAVEVSAVMGAESWPALSESTRASPKPSLSDSLKSVHDGSASLLQGTGIASSSSHKQVITNNANPNTISNHVGSTHQRSMKRGGGGSSSGVSANGGLPQPPQEGSVVETSPNNSIKPETIQRGNFGSQYHQQQRNSFRGNGGGPHPRGPHGSYHHRRDQYHRSFSGRYAHMQPQSMRPPLYTSAPFIPPLVHMQPFSNPMGYPEVPSHVVYYSSLPPEIPRGMPTFGPMLPPSSPIADPQLNNNPDPQLNNIPDPELNTKLVNQIDYYFSNENLIKDTFLRKHMDDQGWVPVSLIAGFKKVLHLTDNTQVILDALRTSTVVEVQGDKLRKRNDWMRWIILQFSTISSPQSLGRSNSDNMLAAHLRSLSVGESSSETRPSSSEGTDQLINEAGIEPSTSEGDSSKPSTAEGDSSKPSAAEGDSNK